MEPDQVRQYADMTRKLTNNVTAQSYIMSLTSSLQSVHRNFLFMFLNGLAHDYIGKDSSLAIDLLLWNRTSAYYSSFQRVNSTFILNLLVELIHFEKGESLLSE